MNKDTVFLERLNWLYENDYERFKIIKALIRAVHDDKKITISKDLNTDTPVVSILINRKYVYKHQCFSEEEANRLIDIVIELNKIIKEK